MLLTFTFDGATVFEVETDAAPRPGDKVVFRMAIDLESLKKGALVAAIVSADHRPKYDFDTLTPRTLLDLTILKPTPLFELKKSLEAYRECAGWRPQGRAFDCRGATFRRPDFYAKYRAVSRRSLRR